MARSATLDDDKGWAQGSTDFHGVVAGMSGNRILDLFGEAIKEAWFDRMITAAYPTEARQRGRRVHEAIAAG